MVPPPRQFTIVAAGRLPLPHNPSRCFFYDRALWASRVPLAEMQSRWSQAATGRWNECPYHSTDWRKVADAASWVLTTQLRRDRNEWDDTPFILAADYEGGTLTEEERDAVTSLLWEPISWTLGADGLMNGQHRACALRAAGAPEVPVLAESLLSGLPSGSSEREWGELVDDAVHDGWDQPSAVGSERWYDADGVAHEGELPTYGTDAADEAAYPFGFWFDLDGHAHVRASYDDPAEADHYAAIDEHRATSRPSLLARLVSAVRGWALLRK